MKTIPAGPERDRIIDEMLGMRMSHHYIASRLGISSQRVDQLVNERRGLCQCGKQPVFGRFCEKHATAKARGETTPTKEASVPRKASPDPPRPVGKNAYNVRALWLYIECLEKALDKQTKDVQG